MKNLILLWLFYLPLSSSILMRTRDILPKHSRRLNSSDPSTPELYNSNSILTANTEGISPTEHTEPQENTTSITVDGEQQPDNEETTTPQEEEFTTPSDQETEEEKRDIENADADFGLEEETEDKPTEVISEPSDNSAESIEKLISNALSHQNGKNPVIIINTASHHSSLNDSTGIQTGQNNPQQTPTVTVVS